MKQSHEHLDSGDVEFYTPPKIIEAARTTLGNIILDPASSAIANRSGVFTARLDRPLTNPIPSASEVLIK